MLVTVATESVGSLPYVATIVTVPVVEAWDVVITATVSVMALRSDTTVAVVSIGTDDELVTVADVLAIPVMDVMAVACALTLLSESDAMIEFRSATTVTGVVTNALVSTTVATTLMMPDSVSSCV